jgi:hypothetical protein
VTLWSWTTWQKSGTENWDMTIVSMPKNNGRWMRHVRPVMVST